MADFNLSTGALEAIVRGNGVVQPVFQILGLSQIAETEQSIKYRALLSDGKHSYSYTIILLNKSMEPISPFAVIKVGSYVRSLIPYEDQDVAMIVVLDMTIIVPGEAVAKIIGFPPPISLDPKPTGSHPLWSTNEGQGDMYGSLLEQMSENFEQLDIAK